MPAFPTSAWTSHIASFGWPSKPVFIFSKTKNQIKGSKATCVFVQKLPLLYYKTESMREVLSAAFGSKKLPTYQVMRIPIRSFLFMLKDRYTIIKAPKSIRRLTRRATRNLCTLIGAISDADCWLTTTTEALLLMLVLNFQRGTVSARHSCSDIRNYQKRKIDEMCMDTVWPTSFVIP